MIAFFPSWIDFCKSQNGIFQIAYDFFFYGGGSGGNFDPVVVFDRGVYLLLVQNEREVLSKKVIYILTRALADLVVDGGEWRGVRRK